VDTNKTQDNCGVQQHEDAESTSTIMPNLKDFLILRSSLGIILTLKFDNFNFDLYFIKRKSSTDGSNTI